MWSPRRRRTREFPFADDEHRAHFPIVHHLTDALDETLLPNWMVGNEQRLDAGVSDSLRRRGCSLDDDRSTQ